MSRSPRRPVPLSVERLDDRVMPSATMVAPINHATSDAIDPSLQAVTYHGALYFTADNGHGGGLYRSAGTAAGTGLVKDIAPGPNPSFASSLTPVGNALYFVANDGAHGDEVWKTDGTAAGTVMVTHLDAGPLGPFPMLLGGLANVNGTLYFDAFDGSHTFQLGKTDGTAAGTTLIQALNAAPLGSVGNTLYLTALGSDGDQLWKSDGTAAGTVLLAKTSGQIGGGAWEPGSTAAVNGTLFFWVAGASGTELWKSDGTPAGTARVADLDGLAAQDGFPFMASVGGALYFSGRDVAHGGELWKSDGTAAGTVLVQDIKAGPTSSSPEDLVAVNGTVFFSADDGTHGRQLWSFSPSPATVSLSAQGAAIKVQEGRKFSGVVATFTDAGGSAASAYTAVITWGDGHTSAGTVTATGKGGYAVSGSNTYTHAGSYAVSVKITRAGATGTAKGTAAVSDAPFWASRVFQRVKKGQSLALVLGALTDTNPFASAGDFTLLIDWGDGQKSGGTLKANAQKTFNIDGTHKYAAVGFYTLTVTITEVGGQTVTVHPLIAVDA